MMIRKVVTRRSRHVRVIIPSIKNRLAIACESQIEKHAYRLFEVAGDIRAYRVQPLMKTLSVNGRETFYFPDALVEYVDGTRAIIEVKPATKLNKPDVAAKMAAARESFAAEGLRFHVVTDDWIYRQPRMNNVELLMFHRRDVLTDRMKRDMTSHIHAMRPETVGELIELLGENDAFLALAHGIVGIDLDQTLSLSSAVFLTGGHRYAAVFH